MKRSVKIPLVLLLVCFGVAGSLLIVFGFLPEMGSDQNIKQPTSNSSEEAPLHELDIAVQKNANDENVFNITMDDFIQSYNGYYWQDHGERYLQAANEWQVSSWDSTVESAYPATQYSFRADENTWTLPVVNVIVPDAGEQIQQIDLNYDEHSYSEATYALFEKDCYYTLKVFFPDLSEEQLTGLYQTINQSSYDNTFPLTQKYRVGSAQLPVKLFYRNGIGVFGYFAIGAPVHFCVIPVDDATIADYKAGGVDVQEIGT